MNKVSIIVPVYNTSKYLNKCIDSIIKQTYKNIEIVLINDGSTDNSLEILKYYESMDKRIIVIDKRNTGVSDTRNIGISASTGEYIMFIDSDDFIDENTIEIMLKCIIKKDVDVVRCNCYKYLKNGKKVIDNLYELSNKKIEKESYITLYNHFLTREKQINCYTPLLLIKRNVCPNFNVELKYMEDSMFYIELLSNSNSIYFLDMPLYHYRYNESSATKSIQNAKSNIYYIYDSFISIVFYLRSKNIITEELYKKICSNIFELIIGKFMIIVKNNYHKSKSEIKKIYKDIDLSKLATDAYLYSNKLKKIEIYLLNNNKINILCFMLKIINLIKR